MKICGLIPAYNEGKTIYEVVRRIKRLGITPVVVDDCSIDKTGEIAKRAGATVLSHETNKGKGEAIKTGFNFLKRFPGLECAVLIDADLQYKPEEAVKLLGPIQRGEADLVMGYRNPNSIPYANRIGNFGWRKVFNILFRTSFKDTNCGFFALSKKAMKKIKNIHGGYIIENSILIEAIKNNLRVKQVPVSVFYKKRRIPKFARMFFGVLLFIIFEGLKYRIRKKI